MNSPVPQYTHYIVSDSIHSQFKTRQKHMRIHTQFVYPAWSKPEYGLLSPPHLMCEKWKEIKAISFILAAVACGSLGQEGRDWQ